MKKDARLAEGDASVDPSAAKKKKQDGEEWNETGDEEMR